jgi:hypothetical protein
MKHVGIYNIYYHKYGVGAKLWYFIRRINISSEFVVLVEELQKEAYQLLHAY